jgi:ABC-type lipoprotein export system ATPase subunit
MNKISVDVSIEAPILHQPSTSETAVRRIFGLASRPRDRILHEGLEVPLEGLTYITGFSGAGKSTLLNVLRKKFPEAALPCELLPEELNVIDCFEGSIEERIEWLGRFGLGEARLLVTPVRHLSVGQRERLKLALLFRGSPQTVIIDEFLSSVDRVTARIISYQLQKLVRKLGIRCYIATAHSDLGDALFPDTLIYLDFEGDHRVETLSSTSVKLPEASEVVIEAGSLADYEALKRFHYMENQVGDEALAESEIVQIVRARFRGKVVGVRVFTKIYPSSYEQLSVFRYLNQLAALSSRVIVHPAFRGLGISKRMEWDAGKTPGVKALFTHSALARYFPFDLGGGFALTAHPSEEASIWQKQFEQKLRDGGVEPETLNSPESAKSFWQSLSSQEQGLLRELVTQALVDYDLRVFRYYEKELGLDLSALRDEQLHKFFLGQIAQLAQNDFWILLSEALYFPMQGLKRLL